MAEEEKSNSTRDFLFFILFLLIISFFWYAQGGLEREPGTPFLESFKTKSEYYITQEDRKNGKGGPQEDVIALFKGGAGQTDLNQEYIEIRAAKTNKNSINILNWTIKNKSGLSLKIPNAVNLPISGKSNIESDIVLPPGGKIIIATGKSPLGYNFRLNKCFGYFEENRDFIPLIFQECPYPKNEIWPSQVSDICLDYIESLPRCKTSDIPLAKAFELGNDCISTINNTLNYNSCVDIHKGDSDFYKDEWRVYLNRGGEFWKQKRENITLSDSSGNIVDELSY